MNDTQRKILQAQKEAGHDRIEDIVAMGFDRDAIFLELAYKLGLKGKEKYRAHFGKMKTQKEIERAIAKLEEIRMRVAPFTKNKKEKKKEDKKEKKLLTPPKPLSKKQRIKKEKAELKLLNSRVSHEEIKKALAELKRLNKMPRILR